MSPEKLVRDKIPEIMERNGESPRIRVASHEELDFLLRKKIVEEAEELLKNGDIEELADIYEALDQFMKHRKIDSGLLETQRLAKNLARGSFSKGYVLETE